MIEKRKKLAVVVLWAIGGIVVSRFWGDAIFAFGGEQFAVGAGLAYFGLLVLFIDDSA